MSEIKKGIINNYNKKNTITPDYYDRKEKNKKDAEKVLDNMAKNINNLTAINDKLKKELEDNA